MRIEHLAFNVADPVAMADWYVQHLGFDIRRQGDAPKHVRFLADQGGQVMLELYHNTAAPVPDYPATDPLVVHLAFVCDDIEPTRQRLLAAGATAVGEPEVTPDGDTVAMLRDPWGLAIQLCHRAQPMV